MNEITLWFMTLFFISHPFLPLPTDFRFFYPFVYFIYANDNFNYQTLFTVEKQPFYSWHGQHLLWDGLNCTCERDKSHPPMDPWMDGHALIIMCFSLMTPHEVPVLKWPSKLIRTLIGKRRNSGVTHQGCNAHRRQRRPPFRKRRNSSSCPTCECVCEEEGCVSRGTTWGQPQ